MHNAQYVFYKTVTRLVLYLKRDVHQKWEELLINPRSDHFLSYSSSVWFRYVLSVNIGTALPSFYAKENIDFQIYRPNIS